jgi:hypothetical protein
MSKNFKTQALDLLERLDPEEMARSSSLNHHVNGMDYLCLQRDPAGVTIKLYLIERPCNPNSGFLVNPHSHRYDFESFLLAGRLKHVRFRKCETGLGLQRQPDWIESRYSPEHGLQRMASVFLRPSQTEYIETGDRYAVRHDEIHTLQMYDDGEPVLIGLVQYPDTAAHSHLYLPDREWPNMKRSQTVTPGPLHFEHLCRRALTIMHAGS